MTEIDLDTALNVLERRGLHFIRRGRTWAACCPLHADKSPSLRIFRGRDGVVRVACYPCGFTLTLPAFLCRLDGHPPHRAFYRAALVECGLPTRDPRPLAKGPPPPSHRPDGMPLPDRAGILSVLERVHLTDIEGLSPAPPRWGEPLCYPPGSWVFVPRWLSCHPRPLPLLPDAQGSLIAGIAAMKEIPRLFCVLRSPGGLVAVWERADPPFVRLCHRLGHEPAVIIEPPTRTIYWHE